MTKRTFEIIQTDQVQPGDWQKFKPVGEGKPTFNRITAILPGRNLVQLDKPGPCWTYLQHPQVIYGRIKMAV